MWEGRGCCWNKVPKPHSPAFWDDNAAIWGSPASSLFTGLHSQPREGAVVSAPAHYHIHGNMSPGQGGWVDDGHTVEHNFLLLMQGSQAEFPFKVKSHWVGMGICPSPHWRISQRQAMRKHPMHTVQQDVWVGWDLCPCSYPCHLSFSDSARHHSGTPPLTLSAWVTTEGPKDCIYFLLSSSEAAFIYRLMFATATPLAVGISWRVRMRQIIWHPQNNQLKLQDHTLSPLLIPWRGKARPEWFSWEPPWLFRTSFLISLPSGHPGHREGEKGEGGKLWLIILWRQPKRGRRICWVWWKPS